MGKQLGVLVEVMSRLFPGENLAEKLPLGLQSEEVHNIRYFSGSVEKGDLFFCKGAHFQEAYLREAEERGALAFVSDRPFASRIPGILVPDLRKTLMPVALAFFDHPERELDLIGLTGTKGKTSTCLELFQIFRHCCGQTGVGLLSSLFLYDGKEKRSASLTTPEPFELVETLDRCRKNGVKTVIMEISSQALKYGRITGLPLSQAAFLNISPDHISPAEHPSFEDYFASKLKIFDHTQNAVLVKGGKYYERIFQKARGCAHVGEVLMEEEEGKLPAPSADADASFSVTELEETQEGLNFRFHWKEGKAKTGQEEVLLSAYGRFNGENAGVALAIAYAAGLSMDKAAAALKEVKTPGRMELTVSADGRLQTLVDYAHNGLSFEKAFAFSKQHFPQSRLYVVFGSPGDKAVNRRQDLPEVASRYADGIFFTADDPGYETYEAITEPMIAIAKGHGIPTWSYPIREEAVKEAFQKAYEAIRQGESAMVLLLGKGIESAQKVRGKSLPISSDHELAKHWMAAYEEGVK